MFENITKLFKKNKKTVLNLGGFNDFRGAFASTQYTDVLSDITYYTCLKILSEGVSKLPIHLYDKDNKRIYDHPLMKVLNERPNEFMTPSTLKQVTEFYRNHYGNAYIYIKYDHLGQVVGLYPIKPKSVEILINDEDSLLPSIMYKFGMGKNAKIFKPYEIIHLKAGQNTYGIKGVSIYETLLTTFNISSQSDKLLEKLYQSGLVSKAVLKFKDSIEANKRDLFIERLSSRIQSNTYNDFLPLPDYIDLQPLNTKLNDTQFFELKKFTANQISAVFGISPTYLNDYSGTSYSSVEAQNIAFYTNTLLPIVKQYEEELNYKLLSDKDRSDGLSLKFNVASILRGDIKTQSEALRTYVTSGIYTVNEARINSGMPAIDGGDVNLINGTYLPLENIGKAYEKGGVI